MHSHGTSAYELARIDRRLSQLFKIRFRLSTTGNSSSSSSTTCSPRSRRSSSIRSAATSPITGSLDIGQLVAVIAAYRELPPPVKELIDWDQQRMDVQVKYDQVIEQFITSPMIEPSDPAASRRLVRNGDRSRRWR